MIEYKPVELFNMHGVSFNKWVYARHDEDVKDDDGGWSVVGYCHHDSKNCWHDTPQQASDAFKRYLLEQELIIRDTAAPRECKFPNCKEKAYKYCRVLVLMMSWDLCEEHLSLANIGKLFEVGEMVSPI